MTALDNDDDDGLTPEVEAEILEHSKVLKEERSRAGEISTAFYDKLAALDAGSIAIAVSVGITILSKQDLHYLSHGLLVAVLCFWLSLLTAIAHNFLLLRSARLDVVYAGYEFIKNAFRTTSQHVPIPPGITAKQWKQIQGSVREEPIKKQRVATARKRRNESIARVVGIISITCFFIGYTLIVIGAWRLWR
jgi:hypothetical protein